MFDKLDKFALRYIGTAADGLAAFGDIMRGFFKFVHDLFWALVALLVIVFGFPLWLIGKCVKRNEEDNCPECKGSQMVRDIDGNLSICWKCKGTGRKEVEQS